MHELAEQAQFLGTAKLFQIKLFDKKGAISLIHWYILPCPTLQNITKPYSNDEEHIDAH